MFLHCDRFSLSKQGMLLLTVYYWKLTHDTVCVLELGAKNLFL